MPCYEPENVDAQRGNGVFDASIRALQLLNQLGCGRQDMHRRLWFLLQRRTDLIRAPPIASASFSPAWKTNTGAAKECGDKEGTLFLRVQ
jgi:hypothetical protein